MGSLAALVLIAVIWSVVKMINSAASGKKPGSQKTLRPQGASAPVREQPRAAEKQAAGSDHPVSTDRAFSTLEKDRPFHSMEFHDEIDDDCYQIFDSRQEDYPNGTNGYTPKLFENKNDIIKGVIWGEILTRREDNQE